MTDTFCADTSPDTHKKVHRHTGKLYRRHEKAHINPVSQAPIQTHQSVCMCEATHGHRHTGTLCRRQKKSHIQTDCLVEENYHTDKQIKCYFLCCTASCEFAQTPIQKKKWVYTTQEYWPCPLSICKKINHNNNDEKQRR